MVVLVWFHLSDPSPFPFVPSPFVAFPATLKVILALPLAGAVQLNVQLEVPETGGLGVLWKISGPVEVVPLTAVKVPAVVDKSKPSRKPNGAAGVCMVLVTEIVSG